MSETATHVVLREDPAMLLAVTRALSPSAVARKASSLPFPLRTSVPQCGKGPLREDE